jgi:hypothetical protein
VSRMRVPAETRNSWPIGSRVFTQPRPNRPDVEPMRWAAVDRYTSGIDAGRRPQEYACPNWHDQSEIIE